MHEAIGSTWLGWLESTAPAVAMRQWLWLYPIVEIVHILGFVILVGAAAMFDLRLLGWSPQIPVLAMARQHLRWARLSLVPIVASGALMFMAHATAMAANPAFRLKLLLLAAAGLNALAFHLGPFKSVQLWNRDVATPTAAKLSAVWSLLLWSGVIACGRLLAYV
jgi:hypothetical protein